MTKPTRDQILQALDDLEEGKPITAELRHAVNLHLKAEGQVIEAMVLEEPKETEAVKFRRMLRIELEALEETSRERELTQVEKDRVNRIWWFAQKD